MSFIEEIIQWAKTPDVNFIGFATSPWHAHGLIASMNFLKKQGISLKGCIYIRPHSTAGYIINESYLPVNEHIEIRYQKNEKNSSLVQKLFFSIKYTFSKTSIVDKRCIYFVESWTVDSSTSGIIAKNVEDIYLHHIVYDEGVATYFPIRLKSRSISEYIKNLFLRFFIYGFGYKYITSNKPYTNTKLFLEGGRKLIENTTIIPYYKEAIKSPTIEDSVNALFDERSVLICTTAWEREEIIDQEDVRIIKLVEECFVTAGYNVVYKPHPRDKNFKKLYGNVAVFDNAGTSIESILLNSFSQPKYVVSISSTILVTCKLFLGLECIDISRLLDKRKIGRYINEISDFQKTFGHLIYEPEHINQLIKK